MKMQSIKMKFVAMMVVIIVGSLLVLGMTSLNMFRTATEESVESKLTDLLYMTKDIIQAEYDKAELISKQLSSNTNLTAFLNGDETKRTEVFDNLTALQETNVAIVESLIVTDADGVSTISSASAEQNVDLNDRVYLQEALRGKTGISDAIISNVTNEPIIAVAHPVYDDIQVEIHQPLDKQVPGRFVIIAQRQSVYASVRRGSNLCHLFQCAPKPVPIDAYILHVH